MGLHSWDVDLVKKTGDFSVLNALEAYIHVRP